MAQRFYEPIARIFTNAGAVGVGYKYYFYQTGTTTPVTTYQDDGLSVANTNPVISDANGRFAEIWYSDLSQLKLVVKDSSDNTIETVDPVGATASAISLNDFDVRPTSYWGLTAGTSTAFTLVANPTISAYANTQTFVVQVHTDCGDSPTLAIDGLSALNWKKYTQQGTKVALKANDLRSSQRYFCINDGVDIVCLNPSSLPILSGSATSLTIATGAITLTNNSSSYNIDTEGSAATDDLDTINGGQDGQIIILSSTNSARVPTLRHNIGNIYLTNLTNLPLYQPYFKVTLRYSSANARWEEVSRATGALIQTQSSLLSTYTSTSNTVAGDTSKPQISEGAEYTTVSFTPLNANSKIKISIQAAIAGSGGGTKTYIAVYVDTTADPLFGAAWETSSAMRHNFLSASYTLTNSSTTTRTYRLKYGSDGVTYINGRGDIGNLYGGMTLSGIIVEEFI